MFKVIPAALVSVVLMSCGGGGGGEASLSSVASPQSLEARRAAPIPALIAEPVSVVNTTLAGNQVLRAIGATSDGGYAVAWLTGTTLYLQAYDSTGAKTGQETVIPVSVQAPTQEAVAQALAGMSVMVLSDGSVVVAYRVSRNTTLPNGSVSVKTGVYFQRFNAQGVMLMGETEVASREEVISSRTPMITDLQTAALADGGFVVAWAVASFSSQFGSISTLFLQRFDSDGQPAGTQVTVGQFPGLAYRITADAHGGFALYTSQLNANFATLGSVYHYDANMTARQLVPPATGAALVLPLEGGYVLFRSSTAGATRQMLDAQGNPVGEAVELPVMPFAVRELSDGTYLAFWTAGDGTVLGQRFAATGALMGQPVTVQSSGVVPALVALADVGFAAAWSAPGEAGDADVYSQRFMEQQTDRKKACLNNAKGLKGRERKAFMNACMA